MLSPYSSNGLVNVVFIVSSDFLSSLNFSFHFILILNHAVSGFVKLNLWRVYLTYPSEQRVRLVHP